jgi:hypothetical protein
MPTRYDEMFRQSQLINSNTRQPMGGGTALMGGMNPSMMAGIAQNSTAMISPPLARVGFGANLFGFGDAMRSPQDDTPLSTPADLNQEAAFTGGKTMRDIYEAARTAELADVSKFRDDQRQRTARQGSSMYEQAQMAMSQRQLMSDARGLSGGAQEFAERGLGAQEQMVLAQIQNATRDQLMQIDAQSLQDSNIATEVGLRAIQLEEQLNPQFRQLAEVRRAAETAFQMGNEAEYTRLMNSYFEQTDQAYGTDLSGIITSGGYNSEALAKTLQKLQNPDTPMERLMDVAIPILAGLGLYKATGAVSASLATGGFLAKALSFAGLASAGTAGVTAAGGTAVATGAALTTNPVGWFILGAAAIALVGWTAYQIYENRDVFWSDEKRDQETQKALNDYRREQRQAGYTPQQIEQGVRAAKDIAQLPPKATNW